MKYVLLLLVCVIFPTIVMSQGIQPGTAGTAFEMCVRDGQCDQNLCNSSDACEDCKWSICCPQGTEESCGPIKEGDVFCQDLYRFDSFEEWESKINLTQARDRKGGGIFVNYIIDSCPDW